MDSSKPADGKFHGEQMKTSRWFITLISALALLTLDGCYKKPRFDVGDHLIPLGSSDPTQIVTVVGVEKDAYRVAVGVKPGNADAGQTRSRQEIDSYYVRVADLPIGGSWTTPTPVPTPTPAPARTTPQPTAPVATATPSPSATPLDVAKLAASVRPALVRLRMFDAKDKPTRNGIGLLVSADGRVVTTARTVEGAAKGVIELSSGAIKNVTGVLASSAPADLAIVKADVSGAPFLAVSSPPSVEQGQQVAVVEMTGRSPADAVSAGTIAAVRNDPAGDTLTLAGKDLHATAGAPVVNERSEVLAFVTADEKGTALNSVRSASALVQLITQIQPKTAPAWPGLASNSPSPSPTASPKPRQTPASGDAALVYTPYPRYPASARFSYFGPQSGTGQYLVKFGADGATTSVQIVKSSGSALLDQAAVDALKSWRAQRGRPSQRVVPITFRRP